MRCEVAQLAVQQVFFQEAHAAEAAGQDSRSSQSAELGSPAAVKPWAALSVSGRRAHARALFPSGRELDARSAPRSARSFAGQN